MSLSSCSSALDAIIAIFGDKINFSSEKNIFEGFKLVETPSENINQLREDNKAGYNISLLDQKYQEGYELLPSIGEQKVLVIPVYFKDYTPEKCIDNPTKALEYIDTAFFGDSNETGWESIRSYYKKSSYGKLDISGMVTSWCPISKNLDEVVSLTSYKDPTIFVLREAINWLKEYYPGIDKEYDQDNDGYIDAVALVYANDYYDQGYNQGYDVKYDEETIEDIKDVLWAYSYWDYTQQPNLSSPVGNVYSWLSYNFLWDGKYSAQIIEDNVSINVPLVDAHTYIHEFGHLLGLDDYYSYDYLDEEPLGRLDMMDHNIGDHNAYSKYLLNWLEPQLIEKEGEYLISTLGEEGNNALLIPANLDYFTYSPYSEYLLIELFTPDNLNELDSSERYMNGKYDIPNHFTKTGVKILHVDSRLVVADESDKTYYYTNINNDVLFHPSKVQFIGANNTSSKSINEDYKLLSLISSRHGKNAFDANRNASNYDLFYNGDKMTEFVFNSGNKLNYIIEILEINEKDKTALISIKNK